MWHCLEVAHLCFPSDPGTSGDACRGERVQGGGAEDACAPPALCALPQRLHDSQINKKLCFAFSWWKMSWASKNDWLTSSEGQRAPPGHLQWQGDVGMRERTVTTTAGFSLKNLQKPHKKNNFFFLKGIFKVKAGLDFIALLLVTGTWIHLFKVLLKIHSGKKKERKINQVFATSRKNMQTSTQPRCQRCKTEQTQDKSKEP